jgi:hypothetical protein
MTNNPWLAQGEGLSVTTQLTAPIERKRSSAA